MSASTLQINKSKHSKLKLASANFTIPLMATVGLFASGAAFLNPLSFVDNSYADSSSVDISVTLAPTIGISTNVNKVDLDISASDFEDLVTGDVIVNVGTNNAYGYTLSVSAEGSETALVNKDNSNLKIPTLSNETTSTTWASDNNLNNTWGFTHNNTDILTANTYLPMVASNTDGDTTIKSTSEPKNSSETKVTFATKIDKTQLSGDYSNKIIFSAVANSAPNTVKYLAKKAGVTTMQGFTSDICSEADIWQEGDEELTLTDTRDNNQYIIRKLADGNCWMSQNLRLTGNSLSAAGHSTTLKASDNDTDLDSGSFEIPNSAIWTDTSVTGNHLVSAADAPIDTTDGPKADSDLAYARGTYYAWPTAVLNTDEINTSSPQTNSICPKNWNLPDSDGSITSANQFRNLYTNHSSNYNSFFKAYDYYYSVGKDTNYYLTGFWNTDNNGYVHFSGGNGRWWSSTSHSSEAKLAWDARAGASVILWQDSTYRFHGLTIRCILASS